MDITKLYQTQFNLNEWMEKIHHPNLKNMREEDNEKRERLDVLNGIIGLPYDKQVKFEAKDLADNSMEFQGFLKEHGNELCALRLIPKNSDLPTLRMRGKTIRDVMGWFKEQAINPHQYRADFVPHPSQDLWGTIFIVNHHGIAGEIMRGGHNQLTQGFHVKDTPKNFRFDFREWKLLSQDQEAEQEIKAIVALLCVPSKHVQDLLKKELKASFAHDYLEGYFEATVSERGIWFVDYNRILGSLFKEFKVNTDSASKSLLQGYCGSPGNARGRVRIINSEDVATAIIEDDDILVCKMTSPDYLPLMQKAAGIVTDQGGILCHAAIVARELKKPCVVGTKKATVVLREGQWVEVDANDGTIIEIKE